MPLSLASFLAEYGLRIGAILLFIAALGFLLRLSNHCVESRPNAFEQFEGGPTLSEYTDRTLKLEAARDALSDDISELDDLVDETCGVVGHVKEAYVGNNSAPLDDTENSLPKDVQMKRMERRKVRAAKRFDDEKAIFGTIAKKTLLECFADGADAKAEAAAEEAAEKDAATADAKRDLAVAVDEVTRVLDAVQVKAALLKSQQILPTLQFTGKQLKKAGEGVASAPPMNMEAFESSVGNPSKKTPSGAQLIASADALLTRAGTIKKTVQDLKVAVQEQKDVIKAMKDAQSRGIAPPR